MDCEKCNNSVAWTSHEHVCIYKFDHYCLWVSNHVGYFNMRLFIEFLLCQFVAGVFNGASFVFIILKECNQFSDFILQPVSQLLTKVLTVAFNVIPAVMCFIFLIMSLTQILQGSNFYLDD